MRAKYCWFALLPIICVLDPVSLGTALADEFPYTAEVTAEDVFIRSGPGSNYYPTDKLQKGDMVEVYRQDPGGWCAIRPPQNSFSWVAAQKLTSIGDGLAAASEDHVVVRVGSSLSDLRDVIQVRLDRKERVNVLVAPDTDDHSGSGWYRIAPPAGEFRWIAVKFLQRARRPLAQQADPNEQARLGRELDDRRSGDAARSGPAAAMPRAPLGGGGAGGRSVASAAYSVDRELSRLDAELSAVVVGDIAGWNLDDLKRRAEAVFDEAETSMDRGRARLLLHKLARLEELKIRYDQMHRGANSGPQNLASENTAERRVVQPRFDGSGRLSPVVSSRAGAPQHALMDSNGAVTHFIAPAPGVNLRPFVNKQIGVNGPRSFMPDFQKQVISVQHVALLDGAKQY